MRWIERTFAGIVLALLVVGLGVIALASPGLTRTLVVWSGAPALSGLTTAEAVDTAEEVRRYVTGSSVGPLPERVAGRIAFDAEAVEHLDDVRDVLSFNRRAVAVCAALAAAWVAFALARKRRRGLADGLLSAAVVTLGIVAGAAILGVIDFDRLFSGFHGLFFAPGTWQFSSESLLIQLFPLRFWVAMAALWALLSLAGAAVLFVASRSLIRERSVGPRQITT